MCACLILAVIACSSPAETENLYESKEFEEFVGLHCEARKLKKERFELAEIIRNWPDSVPNWQAKKKKLASESRTLADSIRGELEVLTGSLSLAEKRGFNDSLESRIGALGCE